MAQRLPWQHTTNIYVCFIRGICAVDCVTIFMQFEINIRAYHEINIRACQTFHNVNFNSTKCT